MACLFTYWENYFAYLASRKSQVIFCKETLMGCFSVQLWLLAPHMVASNLRRDLFSVTLNPSGLSHADVSLTHTCVSLLVLQMLHMQLFSALPLQRLLLSLHSSPGCCYGLSCGLRGSQSHHLFLELQTSFITTVQGNLCHWKLSHLRLLQSQ